MAAGSRPQDDPNPRRLRRGAKQYLKSFLSFKPINVPLVSLLSHLPKAERFYRLPVKRAEVFCRVEGRTFVMLDPCGCCIAREMFWGQGERVKPEDRTALEVFFRLARAADVVLDIGANTGLFSLVAAAANPAAEIHAFEILPKAFLALFHNFCRNNILHRSHCHLRGIGQAESLLTMPRPRPGDPLSTTCSSLTRFASGVRVQFLSLDSLARLLPPARRVLVKIDVEGTENDIFAQGGEFLARFGPDLVCEILPGISKVEEIEPVLQGLSYRLFNIQPGGLSEASRLLPHPDYHDWLFTRKSDEEFNRLSIR